MDETPEQIEAALKKLEAVKAQRARENKLAHYSPYPKQAAFHAAGATRRERLFMCGNQLGKTLAGGMEAAMHATGRYPDWWQGRRFDKPTVGWVAGTTNETTRDTVQRILLGRDSERGTGSIPKDAIAELVSARGIPDLLDSIKVHHVSGGISVIGIKSYQRGREAFQGETLSWIWLDEESPLDLYTECLTRTNVDQGPIWLTFTPILGLSDTVGRFLLEQSPDRHITTMTIDDVDHFSAEERAAIVASYPAHEREARTRGVPALGSGRVFPIEESLITCERRAIPKHWPRLGACDFGWDHPFAAVELAWDRDTDCVYVIKAYRRSQATPREHVKLLYSWGRDLPWAWPRDGRRETLEGAGIALAKQYRDLGLNEMLYKHAQFVDGSVSVEAGLMEMLTRMESGRFKVFGDLNDWFEEFRLYHRQNGRVVKERDDLLCATRYGVMMLRYAECVPKPPPKPRSLHFGGAGGWMST
jgi:phage terminase large subunit-like protein